MRQQVAKVVYDSARTSELDGIRGGVTERRSLGFLANTLSVEVMIEEATGNDYFCSGQVLDRDGGSPRPGLDISLGARGEARTKTNDYGEFSIGGKTNEEGRIFIVHTDDVDVVCRVPVVC